MSDEVEAQLAVALRRESALAGVLRAVGDAGDDLDAVLFGIASNAAVLTGLTAAAVFRDNGDTIAIYVAGPDREPEIQQFTGDATRSSSTTRRGTPCNWQWPCATERRICPPIGSAAGTT